MGCIMKFIMKLLYTNYNNYIIISVGLVNILLQEGIAKITDFGLSNTLKQIMSTSKGEGNIAYIDPLSFKDKYYKRGKQSDLQFWSDFGRFQAGKFPVKVLPQIMTFCYTG